MRPRQIAVVGGGTDDPELAALAEEVGRAVAAGDATLVCGGRGGVMEAAARGARQAGGDVIGVLPTESPDDSNAYVTHAVATGIGHARNVAVAASADAVIAIGGEWGTLAEIAFARRLERPVVALESWTVSGRGAMRDGPGIEVADSPSQAVERALALAAAATRSPRAR
jgi:uncharacterized protein (TIGR00725 family)